MIAVAGALLLLAYAALRACEVALAALAARHGTSYSTPSMVNFWLGWTAAMGAACVLLGFWQAL